LTGNQTLQNIHNQFYTLLLSSSNSYAARYAIDEPFWHEQYHILKYGPGEEYKAHYDGFTGMGRCLSAICYLNDDYEGGEIEFVNFKVKIKPQPGMLIIFPSNYAYRHIAHPIKSGTKYALVTWIKDRQKSELMA
jgi:predicted 2-oxoglutarate/Fe(II)-dependent dioxygenase YbiX